MTEQKKRRENISETLQDARTMTKQKLKKMKIFLRHFKMAEQVRSKRQKRDQILLRHFKMAEQVRSKRLNNSQTLHNG